MFFLFRQNNSGGFFIPPAKFVIVEADNAKEANAIALEHGVYFNGVVLEIDCACCGDRFSRVEDYEAYDSIDEALPCVADSGETDNVPFKLVIKKNN